MAPPDLMVSAAAHAVSHSPVASRVLAAPSPQPTTKASGMLDIVSVCLGLAYWERYTSTALG